jgi:predicted secreted protein
VTVKEVAMPPLGLVRAFVVQWWTVGIVLLYLSVRTAYQGIQSWSGHDPHLVVVGSVEALAALLFLIPRTLRIGALGLLFTFAVVFFVHASRLQFRGDLLVYAAVVSFVAVHGSVPMSWLRPRD